MLISIESILEANSRADSVDKWLAIVLLKRPEGATAARLAVATRLAHIAIAKVRPVRPARQDVVMLG